MFIGRERELKFLRDCYQSERAELVVVYGRRRIGKTELLKQFSQGKQVVFYVCTECTNTEQLERFSQKLLNTGMPAAKFLSKFPDWESALRSIADIPSIPSMSSMSSMPSEHADGNKADGKRGKRVLIIDEFPYMCKGNKEIPSILQNLWDHELKDRNIMIILCGSSVSFMEDELLGEKNPLYGRATGIYKLNPLSFAETKKFFPDYTVEDHLKAYAILGGIPYYLEQFDPHKNIADNIRHNILRKGCVLYNEVEFLLRQELRETGVYNAIIEAVALGNNTLALISSKTQLEKSKITSYLNNLRELGIVEREFSVLAPVKERVGSQRGLYKLTDAYFKFWYNFVFGSYSELEAGDVDGVWVHQVEPHLHKFVSHIFENVCIDYLRQQNQDSRLPFHFTKIGRWWENVTHTVDGKKRTVAEEIDIIATDRSEKNFLLCECKFRHECADVDTLRHLQSKFPVNKYNGTYYYAIFSFYGFSKRLLDMAEKENVLLIDSSKL